jgi:hypothetical protein
VSGGTLGGTATIGGLDVTDGTVAPGQGAGILSTAGLVLGAAATFAVIAVTAGSLGFGTVALGGTLAPTLINGFSPVPGTEFVIIANDGGDAVTGTFAGLAEGALFTAGGSGWRISYAGGDGNDVALTALEPAANDLNGDFHSDIVWRDDAGVVALWEMDGATIVNDTVIATLPDYWHIADTGDFNGDFRHDILWRDTAGTVVMWEMDGATVIGNTALGTLPDYWFIADTGDYTGDLNHDILWRDDAGTIVLWEMDGPAIVDNSAVNTIPTNWQIIG